jgi:membrane protease YdiL (CAAX protease family)
MSSPDSRLVSAFEVLLISAIVIGHNVFHVAPNEVPILFVLGLASFRLRNGGFAAMGLRRPVSWKRVIAIAAAAAALRIVLGEFVIDPLTAHFWPPSIAPEGSESIAGNAGEALKWLLLVWTFAAFGEEIAYRGYLLNRVADLGRHSRAALSLAAIVSSILFGFGHYYKGPAGIIDSGVAGLILAGAYLVSGRVLWTCILAHGFIDTVGVALAFMGWDS